MENFDLTPIEKLMNDSINKLNNMKTKEEIEAVHRGIVQLSPKGKQKGVEFELLVRPLIRYLCENHHPHVTIIITPTDAQLLYGQMSTGTINDYVLD